MKTEADNLTSGELPITAREWCWRVGWIGLRLVLVYILADQFQPFFYQAF